MVLRDSTIVNHLLRVYLGFRAGWVSGSGVQGLRFGAGTFGTSRWFTAFGGGREFGSGCRKRNQCLLVGLKFSVYNMGALTITFSILGVPYNCSIVYPGTEQQ